MPAFGNSVIESLSPGFKGPGDDTLDIDNLAFSYWNTSCTEVGNSGLCISRTEIGEAPGFIRA